MKTAFVIAGILVTLFTEGTALSCTECYSNTGNHCDGTAAGCPPEADSCLSRYSYSEVDGVNTTNFIRKCGVHKKECNKVEMYTTQMSSEVSSTTCCKTDNCNAGPPALPLISTVPNGVSCGTCQSIADAVCVAESTIKCTGIEKKCFLLVSRKEASTQVTSMRGCSSPDFCSSGNNAMITKTCETDEKNSGSGQGGWQFTTVLLHLYSTIVLWQGQDCL